MQQKPPKGERAATFFNFLLPLREASQLCGVVPLAHSFPPPPPPLRIFLAIDVFSARRLCLLCFFLFIWFFSGRGCCLRSRFSLDLSHSPNGKINLSPCTILVLVLVLPVSLGRGKPVWALSFCSHCGPSGEMPRGWQRGRDALRSS